MIEESKLLIFLLAIGLWFFLIFNRERVKQLPEFKIFFLGLIAATFSWCSSILGIFFFQEIVESFEHVFLLCATCLFAVWGYRIFCKKTKESK